MPADETSNSGQIDAIRSTRSADPEVAWLAAGQRSLITAEQLIRMGISRDAIRRRRERGWPTPIYRGVYLVGVSEPPPLALELGAVLSCGDGSPLSRRPAAR